MGKFESYPSISALADDDITLINHNTVTHKISFATLATLIKNRIGLQVDNVPTKDSINLATSGGIYSMIKDEEDRAISVENTKANQATTLSGYGITDAYTKTEADNKFSTFSGDYNDLTNKPTLGTASELDVAESGDASSTQVVKGNDTRLSDARPASDVSSWAKAATKPSYTAAEVGAIPTTDKGSNNGVAELDSTGKVPSSQLPSFVDDVLEFTSLSDFPTVGETGKIYVALDTNKTYRWSGSAYVEISPSLALGETSSTAYRGDRGKTAYDHSQTTSGNPHNVTKSDVGLGNVGNFKAVSTVASQGLTDTEKSNARANIGAGTSSFSGSYNDLTNKPTIPTNTSQLINDSDFIIDNNYVHTDNNFTTTLKTKLDGIASGAEVNVQSDWNETDSTSDAYIANKPTIPSEVTVDSALSTSSKNPVQNKIITNALANKVDDTDLATVAKSGSYNDLSDKPTIPSGVTVDSVLSSTSENPVQNKVINTALSNKASSTHTHTLKIATSTGTSALNLAANTKYELSAGGKTFIFTTPPNGGSTVTIGTTGTASATAVSYQQVGINGTYTEINGTKYMTIDNTNATSYTFTNSAIKTNSVIDVYSSIWGDKVSSVTAKNGSCVVTFSSATTRSVRIYIR